MDKLTKTKYKGVFLDLEGNIYYAHKGELTSASTGIYFSGSSFLKQATVKVAGAATKRINVATLMWETFNEGYVERSHKIGFKDGDPSNCSFNNLTLLNYTDKNKYDMLKVREAVGNRYKNNKEVLKLFPELYEEEGKVYSYEVVLPSKDKIIELDSLTDSFLKNKSIIAIKDEGMIIIKEDIKNKVKLFLEANYKVKVIPTNFLERLT